MPMLNTLRSYPDTLDYESNYKVLEKLFYMFPEKVWRRFFS